MFKYQKNNPTLNTKIGEKTVAKRKHKTKDYLLLSLPENPYIFAVSRLSEEEEKKPVYVKIPLKKRGQTEEQEIFQKTPDFYQGVTYLISPYYNHHTGDKTPSCNCVFWRVTKKDCIHLKKFYELNPDFKKPEEKPEQLKNSEKLESLPHIKIT